MERQALGMMASQRRSRPAQAYSRYGPSDCSTAQGGLDHEASIRPVTQPNRSSATNPDGVKNAVGLGTRIPGQVNDIGFTLPSRYPWIWCTSWSMMNC